MDGNASVFSRRAHFCVWVHLDGREFSTIGSVALFSCTRDTYKIWTLSLACVICTAVSSLTKLVCYTYYMYCTGRISSSDTTFAQPNLTCRSGPMLGASGSR